VYSWVALEVRDRLLAACEKHLAPHGVAFVSYNAHPGGHFREMVANLMRFRARAAPPEPERQVTEGLAFVRWIADSTPSDDLRRLLQSELETLEKREPAVIYHDEFSSAYAPVYFYQFVDHASRHGLQYIADAEFSSMQSARFPAPLADTLHKISDVLVKEQLQDFLRLRKFRQTLLCHASVTLDRTLLPTRVRSLWVASAARSESPRGDSDAGTGETFRTADGWTMSTNHPLAKAALHCLAEAFPESIPFPQLATMAAGRAPAILATEVHGAALEQMLLAAYSAEFVEFHAGPPAFTVNISARPEASPLARWQLREGVNVTTLRHTSIKVEDALLQRLILLLDGSRDHHSLLAELTPFVQSGRARLERHGRLISDHAEIAGMLARELPEALVGVARLALIVR
jgi:methyltransferase-like protein